MKSLNRKKGSTSLIIILFLLVSSTQLRSQEPKIWTSAEIYLGLQKLEVVGTALYFAAHPDDENTRLITYLSNKEKVRTGYLSLTRGDGGQNLIGSEIRELLGVIRTQELMSARSIDGGEQMFTRANDFGYSKHPDETLKIWDHNSVLADAVWAIRRFRPDVVINRFDANSAGRTHGHHTSSAMLSFEAFELAGNPDAYPEQLEFVDLWTPSRLFFNTSWWFYGSRENFENADKSKMMSIDVGAFDPITGYSLTEIASASRSQHKSQGFGSAGSRGSRVEYLELLRGSMPTQKETPFEGIDISWTRLKGGKEIASSIRGIIEDFSFEDPSQSIPALLELRSKVEKIEDTHWREIKLEDLDEIIAACAGLFLEMKSETHYATPGESVEISLEVIGRNSSGIELAEIKLFGLEFDSTLNIPLETNTPWTLSRSFLIPSDFNVTNSYWLEEQGTLGLYNVPDQLMRGLPETPRSIGVIYTLKIGDQKIDFKRELVSKKSDPVKGEVYKPFEIVRPVAINFNKSVYLYADNQPRQIECVVKNLGKKYTGELVFEVPDGWTVDPPIIPLQMENKDESTLITVNVQPPSRQSEGQIRAFLKSDDDLEEARSYYLLEYEHIDDQIVFLPAISKVVRLNLEKAGENIGYIPGAGDEIPTNLREIGYNVTELTPDALLQSSLENYDAIIAGIRAYNTVPELKFAQEKILEYVKNGGVYIVQYNTSFRLVMDDIGPYELVLSRERVAEETAEIRILESDHKVLNYPNTISEEDFDNWVQERGLYFPNEWGPEFEPILSSNDAGEDPKDGGLLISKYGNGYFVYTGYSWFRQIPAGVPGAFRIYVNMISLSDKKQP